MASKRVGDKRLHVRPFACGGRPLERSDADVTGSHPRQHRAGQRSVLAHDVLTGRRHGEAAGRRDAERVHGLADDVFAQHRSERGPAIATTGKRRAAGTFELDVEALAPRRDLLA